MPKPSRLGTDVAVVFGLVLGLILGRSGAQAEPDKRQVVCGIPASLRGAESRAFPITVATKPQKIHAGLPFRMQVSVRTPDRAAPVTDLLVVHEKSMHLFVIAEDLAWVQHLHPQPTVDGAFEVEAALPHPGRYQVVADFWPRGGLPQMASHVLLTADYPGALGSAHLEPTSTEMAHQVTFTLTSTDVWAGESNPMRLALSPRDARLEPWLGAAAHLLLVSEDLEDVVHAHADPSAEGLAFDLRPPRPGRYRLWVQGQIGGELFTVPLVVDAHRKDEKPVTP